MSSERGLLLHLHQSEAADPPLRNEPFARPHCRHKVIVLGDHQGDTGPLRLGDDAPAFREGTGDGFLHQDVFASPGRKGRVRLMQVVGCT